MVAAVLALAVACSESPTAPTNYAPFSQTDIRAGDGAEAVTGSTITVNYTGWFYDLSKPDRKGVAFDSSIGTNPITFVLGSGQVIKGWDLGLVGMRVGGIRRLVIPPSLGYGATRYEAIPPYTTLLFDIELLAVR